MIKIYTFVVEPSFQVGLGASSGLPRVQLPIENLGNKLGFVRADESCGNDDPKQLDASVLIYL
jgi:hypothetical protein